MNLKISYTAIASHTSQISLMGALIVSLLILLTVSTHTPIRRAFTLVALSIMMTVLWLLLNFLKKWLHICDEYFETTVIFMLFSGSLLIQTLWQYIKAPDWI